MIGLMYRFKVARLGRHEELMKEVEDVAEAGEKEKLQYLYSKGLPMEELIQLLERATPAARSLLVDTLNINPPPDAPGFFLHLIVARNKPNALEAFFLSGLKLSGAGMDELLTDHLLPNQDVQSEDQMPMTNVLIKYGASVERVLAKAGADAAKVQAEPDALLQDVRDRRLKAARTLASQMMKR